MFDRMKDIGGQIATKATAAADGIKDGLKSGVESVAESAAEAATTLNEKAIRKSVAQLRTIIEIATQELNSDPIDGAPATLTASVTIAGVALEIQVALKGSADTRNGDSSSVALAKLSHSEPES